MKQKLLPLLILVTVLSALCGCHSTMSIDRGKIEDNYTINIVGEYPEGSKTSLPFKTPVVIKPGAFFSLSSLSMRENTKVVKSSYVCKPDGYKNKSLVRYDITINVQGSSKPLYGSIAFFRAASWASSKAVISYYKLSSSDKFDEASGGRTAFFYEFYDRGGGKRYPTYVMWVSDAPLK
jgi:hypothetical protein